MEYHKAQYQERCYSLSTCYPWEISLGSMGFIFPVMLMILSPYISLLPDKTCYFKK